MAMSSSQLTTIQSVPKRQSGGAIFDPASLRVAYLSESELALLDARDSDLLKELEAFHIDDEAFPPAVVIKDFSEHQVLGAPQPLTYTDSVKSRLDRDHQTGSVSRLAGVRIVVTDRCNMACTYCFVDTNTGSPDITLDELGDGFELLVEFNRNRGAISYQWFGGEPLIRRDLIIEGDRMARSMASAAGLISRPTIVTNGTILNSELVDHFVEFKYGVGVSIDGPPNINSLERRFLSGKTTETIIEKNIATLLRNKVHVGANVTPTAGNLSGLIDTISYVLSLGIRFIYVNSPIPIRGYWVSDGAGWAQSLHKARLHCLSKGAMLFSHLDRVYQAIDTRKPRVYEHLQGCGGLNAALLAGRRLSVLDLNWRCSDYVFALSDIRANPGLLSMARKALFPVARCHQCIAAAICGGPSINDQLLLGQIEPIEQYCRFFETAVRLAVLDPTGLQ